MANSDSKSLEKLWAVKKTNKKLMIVSLIIHFIFGFLIPVIFICPVIYGINFLWLMGFPRNNERDSFMDSLFLKATVGFNILTFVTLIIGIICLVKILREKKHLISVLVYSVFAIISNLMVGILAYRVFEELAVFLYCLLILMFIFLIISSFRIKKMMN